MVFIIILNWNGLKDTLECLHSVYKIDYDNFKVIVVDNCSRDNSVEAIRREFPQVILIESSQNIGYTGGNNLGIHSALDLGADYVWLLNNDTVVEPQSLKELVRTAKSSEKIAMVSPAIYCYSDKKKKQFIGSFLNRNDLKISYPDRVHRTGEEFRYQGPDVCLWGTALFIKKQTIEKIGYLNDDYFAYWEDTEYCLRTMRSGFQNVMCLEAKIYHRSFLDASASLGKHCYYFMLRNRLFIGKTYLKSYSGIFSFFRDYMSDLVSNSGGCLKAGDIEKFNACLNGAWHGVKNITGPMTDDNPMPRPLVTIFKAVASWHPFLISDLIELNFTKILQELYKRYKCKIGKGIL